MNIAYVIVGVNHWDDITHPFMDSVLKFEPDANITVIDNYSDKKYNHDRIHMLRTDRRYSFAKAINFALDYTPYWDKIVVFNNDCMCYGRIREKIENTDDLTFYGSAQNEDGLVYSAWMVISRKVWQDVGKFDENMDAGWEDFDYQVRCKLNGVSLEVLPLPVERGKSTRFEEANYKARWEATRLLYADKHKIETREWFKL